MPLQKAALNTGIQALLTDLFDNSTNLTTAQAREKYATDLSNLIDAFVKTGLVSVTTTGTATAQAGTGAIT